MRNMHFCPKGQLSTNFTADSNEVGKLRTGSAVWGHSPIQRQNTNSKKVTIEKLSKSGLGRSTKVW